jgi:hypothetical protein
VIFRFKSPALHFKPHVSTNPFLVKPGVAPSAQETTMKRKKPLVRSLSGRFSRMTRRELDAESDQYDAEFSAIRAKRVENLRLHPKKPGRPRKSA